MPEYTRTFVLDLSHSEARNFFMEHKSYCNFDLPPYIKFDRILKNVSDILKNKKLNDFYENNKKPQEVEKINHTILHNKDGKYAWRPMQLIHPALYVSLVYEITKKENWDTIQKKMKKLKPKKINCVSIPIALPDRKIQKPKQILQWWERAEQESIKLSLDYEYLIHTDIMNCYGALYTHSVPWAIHGRKKAKENRANNQIGNVIDKHLRDMSYGQTNGIPQGSILMDFIAEIVLGYIDFLLAKKIAKKDIQDYHIIRYRDDYRIFTNSVRDTEEIVKCLSEVLIDFGMTLNPHKTKYSEHVIKDSIKPDKLSWIQQNQKIKNLQKQLLIIHNFAMRFPNSGSLISALQQYNKGLIDKKLNDQRNRNSLYQLISIITDIAYRNPRIYPVSASILSKLIRYIDGKHERIEIIKKIKKKFKKIPNTGHLYIWLQRIIIGFSDVNDLDDVYNCNDESICKVVKCVITDQQDNIKIWQSDWLKPVLKSKIDSSPIVDKSELQKRIGKPIENKEVETFFNYY